MSTTILPTSTNTSTSLAEVTLPILCNDKNQILLVSEIALNIFLKTNDHTLICGNLNLVCRAWHNAYSDDSIWQKIGSIFLMQSNNKDDFFRQFKLLAKMVDTCGGVPKFISIPIFTLDALAIIRWGYAGAITSKDAPEPIMRTNFNGTHVITVNYTISNELIRKTNLTYFFLNYSEELPECWSKASANGFVLSPEFGYLPIKLKERSIFKENWDNLKKFIQGQTRVEKHSIYYYKFKIATSDSQANEAE